MPAELLLEIGTEEIPAGAAESICRVLPDLARERFAAARLEIGKAADVAAMATPRRMALCVADLADRQPDLSEQVVGPPVRAAFDGDGAPTKAAIGFARKQGVDVGALERIEVPGRKGEYVACTRSEPGKSTAEVLPELLEGLVRALPWPKSMRWGYGESAFVRPVHWIVAIFAGEVVPVSYAGVTSGRVTRGHRFLAPGPIVLEGDRQSYVGELRRAFVLVEPETRARAIEGEIARLESEVKAKVRPDPALLNEVTYLVEYPVAVAGEFDPGFLEVPREVIVAAMRSHQRYFAMEDDGGALVNRFLTIAGTITRNPEVVRHGNERVLAARLADARFFFREDQRRSLEQMAAELDGIVFQAKLGSIGAKARRIAKVARWIGERAPGDSDGSDDGELRADDLERAALLCKADLVSHMVGEFPEVQGTMGAHYARLGNEPETVWTAVGEHYSPRGASDRPAPGRSGAALAIADRIDSLVGCFAVGLAPTGSADPYALRRAALGVLQTLRHHGWSLSLAELARCAADGLAGQVEVTAETEAEVLGFLRTRLRGLLVDGEGLSADCVEAALTAGYHDVPDALARAEAVSQLRARTDFAQLGTAFKRVANILKGEEAQGAPEPAKLVETAESALWDSFVAIRDRVGEHLEGGERDYHGALRVLTELKAPVDRFFDEVLVMDKDPAVRQNRLALLGAINATFRQIADFRQLAV